jgi:hypothetical protein
MSLPPDSDVGVSELWAQVDAAVGKARLSAALEVVDELVPDDEDDEGAKRTELVRRFATLRAFWPALVEVLPLGAAEAGTAVLAAAKALPGLFGRKKVTMADINESLLAGSWRRLVLPQGLVEEARSGRGCGRPVLPLLDLAGAALGDDKARGAERPDHCERGYVRPGPRSVTLHQFAHGRFAKGVDERAAGCPPARWADLLARQDRAVQRRPGLRSPVSCRCGDG